MKRLIGTMVVIFLAAGCGQSTKGGGSGVPTITSFTVAPTTLPAGGGSITLAWSVTGATSLSINGGVGSVTPVTTGSISGTVTATTTFTLTATNASGNSMANATVTVGGSPTTAPTINSFTLSPPTLAAAGGGTASWNVTGATSLTIGGPDVQSASATPVTVGNTDYTANQSVVFALFATNSIGTTIKNAVVTVGDDDAPEFDFTAGTTGITYTGTWGFVVDDAVVAPPGSGTSCTAVIQETGTNDVSLNVTFDDTGTYTEFTCTGTFSNAVTPNLITSTSAGFTCTVTGDATCGSFTATATGAFGTATFDENIAADPLVIVWNFTLSGATTASCNGQTRAYAFVVQPPA